MHERRKLDARLLALEHGFGAQVLFERVQFTHEKVPRVHQCTAGLGEDKRQIVDVFEHQVADNEIHRLIRSRPSLRQIGDREAHIGVEHLGSGLR